MSAEFGAVGLVVLVVLAVVNLVLMLRRRGPDEGALLARIAEAQRVDGADTRATLAATERALTTRAEQSRLEAHSMLGDMKTQMAREGGEQRALLEAKLREMAEASAQRLAAIQHSVNAQLAQSIEKEMQGSFQRVIDQFGLVQKAMTDVQAVTGQIGDLKRLFSNVKARGGWGEGQLRALLVDILPEGAWHANRKLRDDSDDVVEFVLVMPSQGHPRPLLALDAKFPSEDYDRLLLASEAGNADDERSARRALEARLRAEARKIAAKYIVPPVTVDFAVMFLPTDGLYVEAARMPGADRDDRAGAPGAGDEPGAAAGAGAVGAHRGDVADDCGECGAHRADAGGGAGGVPADRRGAGEAGEADRDGEPDGGGGAEPDAGDGADAEDGGGAGGAGGGGAAGDRGGGAGGGRTRRGERGGPSPTLLVTASRRRGALGVHTRTIRFAALDCHGPKRGLAMTGRGWDAWPETKGAPGSDPRSPTSLNSPRTARRLINR